MIRSVSAIKLVIMSFTIALLVGCPGINDYLTGLDTVLIQEQVKFGALKNFARKDAPNGELIIERGDRPQTLDTPISAFREWAEALDSVEATIATIRHKLSDLRSNPEKNAGAIAAAEKEIQNKKSTIKELIARDLVIDMAQVPSWRLNHAIQIKEKADTAFLKLQADYKSLYSEEALKKSWRISVQEDTELLDTKPDCMTAFNLSATAKGDLTCSQYTEQVCGHQVDLKCVTMVLLVNSAKQCQTVTVVQPASSANSLNPDLPESTRKAMSKGTEIRRRADWLDELSNCTSATLVRRR